ncbi:MAG: DUF1810 domain-containing protein [Bacteroidota bacterium]|nr:DUF1810 domain-containing protein [Bacteroidota bacterium]
MKEFKLERFVEAQDRVFDTVLQELRAGRKESHWMWFIFPQLKELGRGYKSEYYGIESIEEARAYLAHPILGERLETCFKILLGLKTSNPVRIFGADHQKLHSSATLFLMADSGNELFQKVIDKFWGVTDFETENILRNR